MITMVISILNSGTSTNGIGSMAVGSTFIVG